MNQERIEFDDVEIDKVGGVNYNRQTGEIIDSKFDVIEILSEQKEKEEVNKAKKKEMKKNVGLDSDVEAYRSNWKKDSNFIKLYRTEKREYMSSIKVSVGAYGVLAHLENYIEYKTNRIASPSGDRMTNNDIMNLANISDKTLKKTLNELEDKFFIRRVGNRQAREIYYNPYLMCSGNELNKKTLELFKDYSSITPY